MSIDLNFECTDYNGGTTISILYDTNKFNSEFTSDGLGYKRTLRTATALSKTSTGKSGIGLAQISSNQNLWPMYSIEFELILTLTEMADIFEMFDAQYKASSLALDWTLTLGDLFISEPLTIVDIDGIEFIRQNAFGFPFIPPEAAVPGTDLYIAPLFSVAIVDLLWDWAFQSNNIDYYIVQVKMEELDPLIIDVTAQ